jgi:FkbM family methyltransferase
MYKSQYNQDKYLDYSFFRGKINGIFVDVGAYDGFDISNTYYFEKDRSWSGICIEPSPQSFELLKKNRNCIFENCAISDIEGELDFVNITGWGASASGFKDESGKVIKTAKDSVKEHGGTWEIIKIPTFRLDTILNKHKFRVVDYMSIDVEGFEINVVKSIDWNKYYIQYLSIEKNVSINDVINYLDGFSYKVVTQLTGDLIFKLNR